MSMVGLDEFPDGGRVVGGDTRWFKRVNARNIANTAAATVAANDTPETRVLIELLAIETGFWSTWMSVFADDRDMRLRLINAFAGTAGCFDVDGRATARSGGTL